MCTWRGFFFVQQYLFFFPYFLQSKRNDSLNISFVVLYNLKFSLFLSEQCLMQTLCNVLCQKLQLFLELKSENKPECIYSTLSSHTQRLSLDPFIQLHLIMNVRAHGTNCRSTCLDVCIRVNTATNYKNANGRPGHSKNKKIN